MNHLRLTTLIVQAGPRSWGGGGGGGGEEEK
jgi:hypothetical protein